MTSNIERTPDGYWMCPACGHHTSAFCGTCTEMIVVLDEASGDLQSVRFCGCDCYKALNGVSLWDTLFSPEGTDQSGQASQSNERNESDNGS